MDKYTDRLRLNELEKMFGLPEHCTDVNLGLAKRWYHVGQVWNVPPVSRYYYKANLSEKKISAVVRTTAISKR